MSVCIAGYKEDIKSAVKYMSELTVNELALDTQGSLDYKSAYLHIVHHDMADEVAEWIIGDPEEDIALVEVYYAIVEEAKKQFKINLLGIY